MTETVLLVDDEENILNSVERLFADSDFRILKASSAEAALEMARKQEVAVMLTDEQMPGMKGLELLARMKAVSSDTVKIMMTAHADLPTAIEAINRGEVYRFVVKPWENETLRALVEEAVSRYRVVNSLRKGDEGTLLSLAQTIELKDSYTRGHCDRVAQYALALAEKCSFPPEAKQRIKFGSWLHDCGKIGVPEHILNYEGPLDEAQFELIKNHPVWGAEVARKARLAPEVVNIILHHHERIDGMGYPAGLRAEEIPLEARIVAIADAFDALTTDRPYHKGLNRQEGKRILGEKSGTQLDSELVEIFLQLE